MRTIALGEKEIYRGSLILVNSHYPCRDNDRLCLVPIDVTAEGKASSPPSSLLRKTPSAPEVGEEILMERHACALLTSLMEEIHGWREIAPVSGWRSARQQQEIWDQSLADSGREFTESYVAFPGYSEHQTGLAIDLGYRRSQIDFICPEFPNEGICQRFREHAARFGFVERYPAGKEQVTGISHEPWHFRYVGVPHARIMAKRGLVLEEYLDFLRQFPHGHTPYVSQESGGAEVSYLNACPEDETILEMEEELPYTISGDNMGGFIITVWRGK